MAKSTTPLLPPSMAAALAALPNSAPIVHIPDQTALASADRVLEGVTISINPTRDIPIEQLEELKSITKEVHPTPVFDTSEANAQLKASFERAQRPSLGRVVIFHASETLKYMAHVCCVHTDSVVNLDVVNQFGHHIAIERVQFGTDPRSWSWPQRV